MQLANRRRGTAATKTRHFVSGGGRKPWRQKGTGRAPGGKLPVAALGWGRGRVWADSSGLWLPDAPQRTARSSAGRHLARRSGTGRRLVVEGIALAEPKTKRMVEWRKGLSIEGSVLVVLAAADEGVERAGRNLPDLKVLRVDGLNVYDLLRYRHVVFTKDAVAGIEARLG